MFKNKITVFLKNNIFILLILLFSFALYFKSIKFGYTHHDDTLLIVNNLPFLSDLSNIGKSFRITVFWNYDVSDNFYRPILLINLIIDNIFSNSYFNIFHLTNILIHIFNTFLLYIFLKKINIQKSLSLLLTLFFTIHPVLVQAVSWIPGRNDTILFTFVVLYLISIINYFKITKLINLFWVFLFFFLSLFTKETAIVSVLVTIFYKLFFYKKLENNNGLFKIILGNLVIIFIWFILRKKAIVQGVELSFSATVLDFFRNIQGIFIYLGKIFIPLKLSNFTTLKDYPILLGYFSFLLIFILFIISKKKDIKKIFFGLTIFLLFSAPTLISVNSNRTFVFLEHRTYVPFIGLIIILSEIDIFKNFSFKNKLNKFIAAFLICTFTFINFQHQDSFKDRYSFWFNAVKTAPSNATSHWGLGLTYYNNNNLLEAEKEFLQAIELNPMQPPIHNNLGLIYLDQGKLVEAKEAFQKEIAIGEFPDVLYNYGLVLYRMGSKSIAEEYWLKALNLNPNHDLSLKGMYYLNNERFNLLEAEKYRIRLNKLNIQY